MKIITEKLLDSSDATLTAYLHDYSKEMPTRRPRPAMLVLPGGGYVFCSDRENEPVALAWFSRGYNVFVLCYTVVSASRPAPLELQPLDEVSRAVAEIRRHAAEWEIDPNKIAVSGFSAGGHLAACLGVHWDGPELNAEVDYKGLNRPNALVLGYPVITTRDWGGASAEFPRRELAAHQEKWNDYYATEEFVTKNTPPTFLWSTTTDSCVPCVNSLRFAEVLTKAGVPNELHIFAHGEHGYSVADAEVGNPSVPPCGHVAHWVTLAAEWLDELFGWQE